MLKKSVTISLDGGTIFAILFFTILALTLAYGLGEVRGEETIQKAAHKYVCDKYPHSLDCMVWNDPLGAFASDI